MEDETPLNQEIDQEQQLEQEMKTKLRITNDYMFNRVMRHQDICKDFIEDILPDIKIKKLEYLETQKTLESTVDARGIRLDVYGEDENKVYNIELQRVNIQDLPRRTRYYQGQIDVGLLEKGVDYADLKDCYIIFVCTFDPFDQKYYVYSFENRCKETDQPLKDGTWKIFLNTKGKQGTISNNLKTLLDYFENKTIPSPTKLIKKIDAAVEEANQDKDWRRQVMIENLKFRDERKIGQMEGMQIGEKKGEKKGVQKTAINLLRMNHPIPFIQQVTDLSEEEILTLKKQMQ